jgi:hypothetical protein
MIRHVVILFATLCLCSTAMGEMGVTAVTPKNVDDWDVTFSLDMSRKTSVYQKTNPNVRRIVLTVRQRTEGKWVVGDPEVYIVKKKKVLCKAAAFPMAVAYARKTKKLRETPEEKYWFELNLDLLNESSLRVPVYPANPQKGLELCSQSTEYVLELGDFISEKDPPIKSLKATDKSAP